MKPSLTSVIISLYKESGPGGLTTDEVEQKLGLPHQTVSSRINGLKNKAVLADSGLRRATCRGRKAIVYVLVEFATASSVSSEHPQEQVKSTRFWKSLKIQIVDYLSVRLSGLPEYQQHLFKTELVSDVDALVKRWGVRLSRENKAFEESNRVRRGAINEACRVLGLDTPRIGSAVDIDQARKSKHRIARDNHPDLVSSTNGGLLDSAMEAFKVIEKYNSQVKGDE